MVSERNTDCENHNPKVGGSSPSPATIVICTPVGIMRRGLPFPKARIAASGARGDLIQRSDSPPASRVWHDRDLAVLKKGEVLKCRSNQRDGIWTRAHQRGIQKPKCFPFSYTSEIMRACFASSRSCRRNCCRAIRSSRYWGRPAVPTRALSMAWRSMPVRIPIN
jgi:hypothetical protein